MPLRNVTSEAEAPSCPWESFHSAWANTIVRHLNRHWLPPRFRAEPETHLPTKK